MRRRLWNKTLWVILPLAVLLLVLPQTVRLLSGNPHPFGSETYETIRLVRQYSADRQLTYDALRDRPQRVNLLIPALAYLPESPLLYQGMAFGLGLISILLLHAILCTYLHDRQRIFYVLFLAVISPFYIFFFNQFSTAAVAFVILLAAFWLLQKWELLSLLLFILLPLLDPFTAIAGVALFVIFVFVKRSLLVAKKVILVSVGGFLLSYFLNGTTLFYHVFPEHYLSAFLSELGANGGYTLPLLILASMGFYLLWKKSVPVIIGSLSVLLCFVLTYFFPIFMPVVALVACVYAGTALWSLTRRAWSNTLLRDATLLLVFCTLFFSTVSFENRLVDAPPSRAFVDSLHALREATPANSTILALPSYAPYINYFAERKAAYDSYLDTAPTSRAENIRDMVKNTYASRNVQTTSALLEELQVTHIFVDDQTRLYLTERKTTGALFLFEYGNIFVRQDLAQGVAVWQYDAVTAHVMND